MSKTSMSKQKVLRKERNSDVIRRMKNGDQLSSFNSYSSWFPPRPIISKDADAVKELYGPDSKPIIPQVQVSLSQEKETKGPHTLRLA
ncbi:MAG: hypothetical protein HRU19_17425 [Pseudobacteriovorax sp.]|nr:hypothetical protein [Pseudobacteriovorax sp.]